MKHLGICLWLTLMAPLCWAQSLTQLPNGTPLFFENDPDMPRGATVFSFRGGPALVLPTQQGLVAWLSEILHEGPATMSDREYKDLLFKLGVRIEVSAKPFVLQITVLSPPESQRRAFELVKLAIENPRVGEADAQRLFAKVLANLRMQFEDPDWVLRYYAVRDFVAEAPQAMTGDTSPESFAKLKREQLLAVMPQLVNFRKLVVAYVGPQQVAEVKSDLNEVFGERLKSKAESYKPALAPMPKLKGLSYVVIDKPKATNHQMMFIYPQSLERDSESYSLGSVMQEMLGGGWSADLFKTLRTERGLTYGAYSGQSMNLLPFWYVYTFGGSEQVKGLLSGVPEVVDRYKKRPLSDDEFNQAKERMQNAYLQAVELPVDRLTRPLNLYLNGINPEASKRLPKDLAKMHLTQLRRFKARLPNSSGVVYLLGDKEVLLAALAATGVKTEHVRVVEWADIQ